MTKRASQALTLLYLNVCGGQWFEELMAYICQVAGHVDVFCLQEVLDTPTDKTWNDERINGRFYGQRTDLLRQLKLALPDYQPLFAWYSRLSTVDFPLYIGNATFVRTGNAVADILESGDKMVYGSRDSMVGEDIESLPRSVQYTVLKLKGNKELTVFNFHGAWQRVGKKDTQKRLSQFRALQAVVESFHGPKVLGGDFNTFPTSKSSRLLEEAGMANLVRENGIVSTKSPLYERAAQNGSHADNIFVSGIQVVEFEVPEVVASDHLPLVLRLSV
ncbi:MAG: endonuclease/exonuclease/phosphatase family protein [bacterium]|nr:endonuclease/exonuclease/phosphatase family protein [bacterium]